MRVQACIAGGGPAGMMLGLLLARAGVRTAVFEKHADFLRDFRGDTIHPSTLTIMDELGMLEEFLQQPHQRVTQLRGNVGNATVTVADFTRLPTRCKFLAFMPQWEFLNFLARRAAAFDNFSLHVQTSVDDLIWQDGVVAGARGHGPDGPLEVRADLTVAADGRTSVVRAGAHLDVVELGAPMDVLWLRLSKRRDDPHDTFGYIRDGRIMALIDRGDYWQCAYVIPKGSETALHERGIAALRDQIAQAVPFLHDRVGELADWRDVRLLTVACNRLPRWYRPGLLCIGDAAHAMSPIGGVGINLAIQDAVAAANLLSVPLLEGTLKTADLQRVQRRREFPAKATQALQLLVQRHIIGRVLSNQSTALLQYLPAVARTMPFLSRIPTRLVGLGVRPEHIRKM